MTFRFYIFSQKELTLENSACHIIAVMNNQKPTANQKPVFLKAVRLVNKF